MMSLINCELILHLHKAVLQYFWANIFIFQQVIGQNYSYFWMKWELNNNKDSHKD